MLDRLYHPGGPRQARREFLRAGGGLAVAGYLLPSAFGTARAEGPADAGPGAAFGRARSCILVYLLGGPPHLDTFDLKPLAAAEVRGPFQPIATNAGRDHWGPCSSALLAGGGIRGGQVIGASDKIGAYPVTEPIDPVDIHATMYHALGMDTEQVIHDPTQRLANLHRPGDQRVAGVNGLVAARQIVDPRT